MDRLVLVLSREQRRPGQYSKCHDAQRVDIGTRTGQPTSLVQLRRDVAWGANVASAGARELLGRALELDDTEVEDLDHELVVSLDEIEVGRLDVPVDYPLLVDGLEPARDLNQELARMPPWQASPRLLAQ